MAPRSPQIASIFGGENDALKGAGLIALSWNVAAINNNPFEYYITHHDPKYNKLMENVQKFIDQPEDSDVPVDQVFTRAMFEQLKVRALPLLDVLLFPGTT